MTKGKVGSVHDVRTWALVPPRSRRRCSCCGRSATHIGLGNGVALTSGCEFYVRKWCKDWKAAYAMVTGSEGGVAGKVEP